MNGLPTINRRITLISASGQEFASRVEDVGEDWLTVARPFDLPIGQPIVAGSGLMATWHASNGICTMPCRLVTTRREGAVRLWDVNVAGQVWREQRRAYVRAAAIGMVSMRWSLGEPDEHAGSQPSETEFETSGALEDLSEAALRYRCRDRNLDAEALVGATVSMSLHMREISVDMPAEVVRVVRTIQRIPSREPAPWQIVLRFVNPGRIADDLRRIVFREQLRERNGR
jgi:c-di-GMP-binding flagellar brake protein YcgR